MISSVMLNFKGACLLSVLALMSCSPSIQTTLVPIIDSSGEVIVLKPSRFTVSKSTRESDVLRLHEDIIKSMPDGFPSQLVRLDPDRGEAVAGALLIATGTVREKGKSVDTGVLFPAGIVKHVNVPQERIDAAVPAIQQAYYKQLGKYGRLIPLSQVEKNE